MTQLALLEDGIEEAFLTFHHNNPSVYASIVDLARGWKQSGHSKVGMKMLFEVLRWQRGLAGIKDDAGFKLNNNFTSRYARIIMANEPDLRGFFEVRSLHDGEVAA